jgi:hypothetical protein
VSAAVGQTRAMHRETKSTAILWIESARLVLRRMRATDLELFMAYRKAGHAQFPDWKKHLNDLRKTKACHPCFSHLVIRFVKHFYAFSALRYFCLHFSASLFRLRLRCFASLSSIGWATEDRVKNRPHFTIGDGEIDIRLIPAIF